MKTIFRLLCGWMAIALAACSGDELQQIEPLQKPVAQKTISVKAYTPSEQAATRLAFEDKGAEGLKLSWTDGDAFTALIGGEKVTFVYNESSKEFTANVNESVTLTDGLKAYYPAYYGENFEKDFSQQNGLLNAATTYMEGVYEGDAFKFTHSTAILKASFSALPQNAVISSIQISGAVDITIANYNSSAAAYINLPAIPKDGQLKFMVETATRDVYTATKTVTAEEGIKTGVYYNTTVKLQETYWLPTGGEFNSAVETFLQSNSSLTKIKFVANSSNTNKDNQISNSRAYMVAGSDNTLEIHTSEAEFVFNKDCSRMFSDLINIQSIDFGNCVNMENVMNMANMFNGCSALESLDLSSFNTERVINMFYMFQDCSSLTSLKVSSFNTSKVKSMNYMFNNCSSLTSLDLSSFNTANVMKMVYMFNSCSSLTSLNVSSFNTENVTDMDYMFNSCSSLTSLDLSSFNTANVTNMGSMFSDCSALASLNLSSFNTAKVTNMAAMFNKCSALTSLDLSSFNTSNVEAMNFMFFKCENLSSLNLSSFNTANVTNMASMFDDCSALESLNVSSFNTANVTNMCEMFSRCSSLTSLDLRNFNTANVTDMYCMFNECSALTLLDLSNFNTSKVTDMNFMFFQCSALTSLNVSNFNTENVTDMASMFYGCSLLTSLDLSSFDTSKVTTMDGMFYDCFSISELKLINFDFGKVTDFDGMFTNLAKYDNATVPVYVYVTQDSYNILKDKSTGINSAYAWFVDENGSTFED